MEGLNKNTYVKKDDMRGDWLTQSVKHLTLGFSSGHDLTVHADSSEPAWDSLSLSLSPSPTSVFFSFSFSLSLFLPQNKLKRKHFLEEQYEF